MARGLVRLALQSAKLKGEAIALIGSGTLNDENVDLIISLVASGEIKPWQIQNLRLWRSSEALFIRVLQELEKHGNDGLWTVVDIVGMFLHGGSNVPSKELQTLTKRVLLAPKLFEATRNNMDGYHMEQLVHRLIKLGAVDKAYAAKLAKQLMGERNNTIFRLGLFAASRAGSLEELTDQLAIANAVANPPLSTSEVRKTAASAWRYHLEGRNFVGTRGVAMVPGWLQDALAVHPGGLEALWLYFLLLRNHLVRGAAAAFAIAPKAFVFSKAVPFSEHRIRRAIRLLIDVGVLERVTAGGRGANDPALYALSDGTMRGGRDE